MRDRWAEHWFDSDDKLAWQQAGVYEPGEALSAIQHGFTPDTFARWGRHQLTVEAARRAVELGLTPDQLDHTINGNSLGIMLQTGSRVDEIRALMAEYPILLPEERWG